MNKKILNKKKGFTLIEILVVVLIIGILATIALPSYHKAILKARAAEAINLLTMVRSKQAVSYSKTKTFFTRFDEIPGGKLTARSESWLPASPNILSVGDYEVELNPDRQCAISRYKPSGEEKFSFSISYFRNGLGCTGSICSGIPDIVALADDLCNNPVPPTPPTGCSNPSFDPNSCIYPKILSSDGCDCVCPNEVRTACETLPTFTFNSNTCVCDCDQSKVSVPANVENYNFNTLTCDYECKLTADICTAQEKIFDSNNCQCVNCIVINNKCHCPDGMLNIDGTCGYCNDENYYSFSVGNGLFGGLCCQGETPVFNSQTQTCEPCPSGSNWNNQLRECVCTAPNQTLINGTCQCDIQNNWQPVQMGNAAENGCCNTQNSNYLAATTGDFQYPSICCNTGIISYSYTLEGHLWGFEKIYKRGCCPADRPYKYQDPPYFGYSDGNIDLTPYCMKCPSVSQTMVSGVCQECTADKYSLYREDWGYAECLSCGEHHVMIPNQGCVCDATNSWMEAGYGNLLENGCCQSQYLRSLPYEGGSIKACCAYEAYTYKWNIRTQNSLGGCCSAERPYVHKEHQDNTDSDPGPNAMCRKCPNPTHTWTTAQGCHSCPTGQYGEYSQSVGYAICKTCGLHQMVNTTGDGCVCQTGWQAVPYGNALENGCCDNSNVKVLGNVLGSQETIKACCQFDAYTYGGSVRMSSSQAGCCSAERPYAYQTHSTSNWDPGAGVMCMKCQNENLTFVGNSCKTCAQAYPGQNRVPSYNPANGYADCVCPEGQVEINGVCKTCEQAYGTGYTYTPYGNGSHCCAPGYLVSSGTATGCSYCPNATQAYLNNTCVSCGSDAYPQYNESLGYAECIACAEHNIVNNTNDGCKCDAQNGWPSADYGTAFENGCCAQANRKVLSKGGKTLSVCCVYDAFLYQHSTGLRGYCCTGSRQYSRADVSNFSITDNPEMAINNMCRMCPNETDTMKNGVCMSCEQAYPGQNRIAEVGPYYGNIVTAQGYANCSCPSTTIDVNGTCKTCEQIHGAGSTWTYYGVGNYGDHCCAPGHQPQNNTTTGCAPCLVNETPNTSCASGCIDCSAPAAFSRVGSCACGCYTGGATEILYYDNFLHCCKCDGKVGVTDDPRFNPNGNGCYIGSGN